MGNIVVSLKRFLSNKNTVTILAVLIGVLVLWYFYNLRVEQAITTRRVPFAVNGVDTGKRIEGDNVDYKELTQSSIQDNDIVTDLSEIEGKYVCYGTSVPKNGFFHKSQICDKLPNSVFEDIPEGYAVFNLPVTNESTYANSILPGDYIDIYMSAVDDANQILYGPLVESIEVLEVRDSAGKDTFWDSDHGDPAIMLFAVPEDMNKLLTYTQLITTNSIELRPVPRSASYTQNPGETIVASQTLRNFILGKVATLAD